MARIDAILELVKEQGASDLPRHDRGPADGAASAARSRRSRHPRCRASCSSCCCSRSWIPRLRARYERDKDVDFAYEVPGVGARALQHLRADPWRCGRVPRAAEPRVDDRAARPARDGDAAHRAGARSGHRHRPAGNREVDARWRRSSTTSIARRRSTSSPSRIRSSTGTRTIRRWSPSARSVATRRASRRPCARRCARTRT